MYSARILADSIAPNGKRLTTMECTYPRMIHSELLTHREFSRNSASSRAIPIAKMIEQVQTDPVMPVWWGKNQMGMQAREELDDAAKAEAMRYWLMGRSLAVNTAEKLVSLGVHKQIVNRVLEPWIWITTIISATEWENFFFLRCHRDAQPEHGHIAILMRDALEASTPEAIGAFGWHLPLIRDEDMQEWRAFNIPTDELIKVSVGRCARVSYLTHDGRRDLSADVKLHDQLMQDGHWSPFEHVARPLPDAQQSSGNFKGWEQYRKQFPREYAGGNFAS